MSGALLMRLAVLGLVVLAGCATQGTKMATPVPTSSAGELDPNDKFEGLVDSRQITIPSRTTRGPEAANFANGLAMAPQAAAPIVEFHVFALGQSDSMLVIGPAPQRRTLLVDAGEVAWNSRANCQQIRMRVLALTGRTHVDYALITHYHVDHIGAPETTNANTGRVNHSGGLFCLLDTGPEFFSIGTLIDHGPARFAPSNHAVLDAIVAGVPEWNALGTLGSREVARFGTAQIDLGLGISVDVLAFGGSVTANDPGALAAVEAAHPGTYQPGAEASPNDFSIALEFTVGDFELFSAGDLSGAPGEPPYAAYIENGHNQIYTNVESYMVRRWREQGRESDVEVYRANHHGSENSSTVDLLDELRPELVLYSAGGRYGHPKRQTVDRVAAMGADQIVTSAAATDTWPDGFPAKYGNGWENPVGDIAILVPVGGDYYSVSTAEQAFNYPDYSDTQEAQR